MGGVAFGARHKAYQCGFLLKPISDRRVEER
jgi:hypothetical protein